MINWNNKTFNISIYYFKYSIRIWWGWCLEDDTSSDRWTDGPKPEQWTDNTFETQNCHYNLQISLTQYLSGFNLCLSSSFSSKDEMFDQVGWLYEWNQELDLMILA